MAQIDELQGIIILTSMNLTSNVRLMSIHRCSYSGIICPQAGWILWPPYFVRTNRDFVLVSARIQQTADANRGPAFCG